jgi:hypothetical protein
VTVNFSLFDITLVLYCCAAADYGCSWGRSGHHDSRLFSSSMLLLHTNYCS